MRTRKGIDIDHVKLLESRFFGLSATDLKKLAFEIAERYGLEHRFNMEKRTAGWDWLAGFRKRHPDIRHQVCENRRQLVLPVLWALTGREFKPFLTRTSKQLLIITLIIPEFTTLTKAHLQQSKKTPKFLLPMEKNRLVH